jgi:hypothetical protein
LICQGNQEIARKAILVPSDLFVQSLGGYAIELGKIGIQHHTPATHHENSAGNLGRRLLRVLAHELMMIWQAVGMPSRFLSALRRNLTNARATSTLRTLATMIAPCSANSMGAVRLPPLPDFDVAFCNIKAAFTARRLRSQFATLKP